MKLIRDSWKTAKVKLIAGHLRSTIEREREISQEFFATDPIALSHYVHYVETSFLSSSRRADKDRVQTATRLLEVAPSPPSSNPLITGNRPRDRLLITDVGIEGELI